MEKKKSGDEVAMAIGDVFVCTYIFGKRSMFVRTLCVNDDLQRIMYGEFTYAHVKISNHMMPY